MNAILDNEPKYTKTIWDDLENWYENHFHKHGRHITPEAKQDLEKIICTRSPGTTRGGLGESESSPASTENSTISGAV